MRTDMTEPLLKITDLEVSYATRAGLVKAVDKVSLEVQRGETLGLVGESGCGKSTLGFSILRLVRPPGEITGGQIIFNGEDLLQKTEQEMRTIRGKRIAMIFQDPMTCLNPLQRIDDHFIETVRTHEKAVSAQEARQKAAELVDRLGIIADRLTDYPHQLSGGMRQRIMIGLALILNSELIIADEPTTSLDVIVEAQILDLMKELKASFELSMILITHNMGIVAELADRIAVMYAGKLMEVASAVELYDKPLHPYTQGLLRSIPNISLDSQKLETMPGSPPDLIEPPPGCRFHPRCPHVMDKCHTYEPIMKEVEDGHRVACWLY
ncbi:MAG: ABC transporter ATP-binding protein [Anaerolineae bacterium]|nr:ABC transporter ATP-binding protein [Anaerolineae bacterium]